MRIAMTLLALSLSLGVTACKKKKAEDTSAGSGSAMAGSDMGSGSAAAPDVGSAGSADTGSADTGSAGSADTGSAGSAAAATDDMPNKAGNCPSTVAGATTKADVKGKTVVLTITSDDKDAIASIQRRTEVLLKEKSDATAGTGHDQKGSHGGAQGICPVFLGEGGTATSKKAAKGVTITITPKGDAAELKKTIDDRITKAADWVKANVKEGDAGTGGGVGGGKGEHGGNHSGEGDGKGKERKGGTGGGAGTGGGGGMGTGGGGGTGGSGSAAK